MQKAHAELLDFVAAHPEIKLEASHSNIPAAIRPDFWKLYDELSARLLESTSPALYRDVATLSQNYIATESAVMQMLGLEVNPNPGGITRFLYSPVSVFGIGNHGSALLDLIDKRADSSAFEAATAGIVRDVFPEQCRLGYEQWVILSLFRLLGAKSLLEVNVRGFTTRDICSSAAEFVQPPRETRIFSTKRRPASIVMPPDWIVACEKGYAAFKSDVVAFQEPRRLAANASASREWYPNTLPVMLPAVTLVYTGAAAEDIAVVADSKRICRPQIVLECRWEQDWFSPENMAEIQLHHAALKPTLGTVVICRADAPQQAPAEAVEGINIVAVGFESDRLAVIASALKNAAAPPETVPAGQAPGGPSSDDMTTDAGLAT